MAGLSYKVLMETDQASLKQENAESSGGCTDEDIFPHLERAVNNRNAALVKECLQSLTAEGRKKVLEKIKTYTIGCLKIDGESSYFEQKIIGELIEVSDLKLMDSTISKAIMDGTEEIVLDWLNTLERRGDCNMYVNERGYTLLQLATYFKRTDIIRGLLNAGADSNVKWFRLQSSVFTLALSTENDEIIQLVEENYNPNDLDFCNAIARGNIRFTRKLITEHQHFKTSLEIISSIRRNKIEIVRILLENNAINDFDETCKMCLYQSACFYKDMDMLQLLFEFQIPFYVYNLIHAIALGREQIVKKLLEHKNSSDMLEWKTWNEETIAHAFCEMIEKMPGMAEHMLNQCLDINNLEITSSQLKVQYSYCLLQDHRKAEYKALLTEHVIDSHPLSLMVKHERLNLLQHPVVLSFLYTKWKKFGACIYFSNLLLYCAFLAFLTIFAFIVPNPQSMFCLQANVSKEENGNITLASCELSISRRAFIWITSLGVLAIVVIRIILELYQLCTQFWKYVKNWVNWMEIILILTSAVFVIFFANFDCPCIHDWQWQIGIVAVFLGWIELTVFVSRLPYFGIYVVMFLEICKTAGSVVIFASFLSISFAIAFYMAFFEPTIARSPFSNFPRSLLKTITMTTGELDFDVIFRQSPDGASSMAPEVPFLPVSVIIWLLFIVLMPVLLINMLVGLAVGDIDSIRKNAELKKLALQVELILSIEDQVKFKWLKERIYVAKDEDSPNTKALNREDCCPCPNCVRILVPDVIKIFKEKAASTTGMGRKGLLGLVKKYS